MAVRSLNKAMIIGNLTRDPELRYTANGTAIATFGVATNREYTPSDSQESVESAEFHNVVAWSKLAELCNQLLAKGNKVYIEGRLQTRDWVDAETSKKMYRTEIVCEEMLVLSSPRNGESSFTSESGATGTVSQPSKSNSEVSPEVETVEQTGDIPF
ncbi:single-stranded DNA-binding protein [bacterium]|uniref:Single-stranded DNA-binding protein n=2 Tax=Katanobacteria TaxID=422282 RepID=A0A2M7X2V8_UNCKA|nr:single-stranded DNA-binding protein [bacterium]PIP56938.1 MAG: single-stranded DNA-binding protein [candidate division WWE3 bacterium CG22_combo_CG10-13_8_21_14_all_39_12]PJA40503.1 MAG: single-stranded DNA-binding protein [candidate division WWE3 bacterium CG_4_9_14_3_um_filter_39_7]